MVLILHDYAIWSKSLLNLLLELRKIGFGCLDGQMNPWEAANQTLR
jgi:hypothetical protein